MSSRKLSVANMVLAAMFLAIALLLPLVTMQIPQIGSMLCPMHLPVLLCGFFCGPVYGAIVGAIAPLLRFLIFGMPTIFPSGIGMCVELAVYGLVSGLLYRVLPKKKIFIYVSLLSAMIIGRIIWGAVRLLLYGLGSSAFTWEVFISGAFLNAIPGIILQIVLIPVLVMVLEKRIPGMKRK